MAGSLRPRNGGQPSSKSMAQPARPSPVPARSGAEEGERRGRTKGFYTQKDPFTGELPGFVFDLAVPELLRPHHGMPLVPWAAVAAMTRAMTTTKNGSFLRACLGPLVRPMSRDPTEMTIDQGPRLGPHEDRRGPKGEAKGRGRHRPGKGGREDPGPPRQRDDRGRNTRGGRRDDRRPPPRREEPSERRSPGRDERRRRDGPADDRRDRHTDRLRDDRRHQSDPPPPRRAGDHSRDGGEDRRRDGGGDRGDRGGRRRDDAPRDREEPGSGR